MASTTEPVPGFSFYSGDGRPGVRRAGGYVQEEFLRELAWPRGLRAYREMMDNDPVVGGLLNLIGGLFRTLEWKIEPCDPEKPEDVDAAEFAEEELEYLRPSLREQLSAALDVFPFGFSLAELVYQRRKDGRVGWKEWRWLAPETLQRWVFDLDTDEPQAFVQIPPSDYVQRTIPLERCLHLRTTRRKGNPEGKSILRNAWRSWFYKTKLEEIEAIGVERDLAGLPVMRIPARYMAPTASTDDKAVYDEAKRLVRNVRRDEHEGLVLPSDYGADGKNRLVEFELLSTGGTRSIDVGKVIERYDARIAMSALADFLLLGHQQVGTFSLSSDKTSMFTVVFGGYADVLAEEITTQAIGQLLYLNALSGRAKLTHGDFEKEDVSVTTTAIANLVKGGVLEPGEPNLTKAVRELLGLPEPDPEWLKDEEARRASEAEQLVATSPKEQLLAGIAADPNKPRGPVTNGHGEQPPVGKFDPFDKSWRTQARVPSGVPTGGQWTSGAGGFVPLSGVAGLTREQRLVDAGLEPSPPSPAVDPRSIGELALPENHVPIASVRREQYDALVASGQLPVVMAEKQKLLDEASVFVAMKPAALNRVLEDGSIKTVHETGKTRAATVGFDEYMRRRNEAEEQLFGRHDLTYGYVSRDGYSSPLTSGSMRKGGELMMLDGVAPYGEARVRLKSEVRQRTTVVDADSLNTHYAGVINIPPSHMTNAHPMSFTSQPNMNLTRDQIPATRFEDAVYGFTEAQVRGGVRVSDIAEVKFIGGGPSAVLERRLRAANIPFHVDPAYPEWSGSERPIYR